MLFDVFMHIYVRSIGGRRLHRFDDVDANKNMLGRNANSLYKCRDNFRARTTFAVGYVAVASHEIVIVMLKQTHSHYSFSRGACNVYL